MDSNETSIIPVSESKKKEELGKILEENFEQALENLITGKTPRDVVFQRPARGGIQVDYVPGWWFIQQLNALFGYRWDFEVTEQDIGKVQIWVKGKLTIRGRDGAMISKTQFGGSDVKFKKGTTEVIDIGDDLKAAATDALKKCATQLGIAADIYGKREQVEQTGASRSQLDTLYSVGKAVGKSSEEVDAFCAEIHHGAKPQELEQIDVLGLIQELRKMKKNEE